MSDPQNPRRASAVAILVLSFVACGRSSTPEAPVQAIARASVLSLTINPNGYLGSICIEGGQCNNGSSLPIPLDAGTYWITAPATKDVSTGSSTYLGAFSVDAAGVFSSVAGSHLEDSLDVPTGSPSASVTLTAKVSSVTVNFHGYQGTVTWDQVREIASASGPTKLLQGRKYALYSADSHDNTAGDLYFSNGYGISVYSDRIDIDERTGQHFTKTGNFELTANTASVTVDFNTYPGTLNWFRVGDLVPDGVAVSLIVGREYALSTSDSKAADGSNSNYFSSRGYSLKVKVSEVEPDQELAAHFTHPSAFTIRARVAPVSVELLDYPGTVDWFRLGTVTSGSSTPLIIGRNYALHSYDSRAMSSDDQYFGGYAITVNDNADNIPSNGLTAQGDASESFTSSGLVLAARLRKMTVVPNNSPPPICIGNMPCLAPSESNVVYLIAGRRYAVQSASSLLSVPATGNCSPTPLSVGPGSVDVSCTILGAPPPFQLEPSGYRGQICVDGVQCVSGGGMTIPLAAGHYWITAPSTKGDDNSSTLGGLTVQASGLIKLDPPVSPGLGLAAYFTALYAESKLTAKVSSVKINFHGYQGTMAWDGVTSLTSVTAAQGTPLLQWRKYALYCGDSHEISLNDAYLSEGYGIMVGASQLSPDTRTLSHFTASGLELTATTADVTVGFNGYLGTLNWFGIRELTSTSGATSLVVGRKYALSSTDSKSNDAANSNYFSSYGYAVDVVSGDLSPDPEVLAHFTHGPGSLTMAARTVDIAPELHGYPGVIDVFRVSTLTNHVVRKLIVGRKYALHTADSRAVDSGTQYFSPDPAYGVTAKDDADLSPLNPLSFDTNTGKSFKSPGQELEARIVATTITASSGYHDPLCVGNFPWAAADAPLNLPLVANRRYVLHNASELEFATPSSGSCAPITLPLPGGHQATIEFLCEGFVPVRVQRFLAGMYAPLANMQVDVLQGTTVVTTAITNQNGDAVVLLPGAGPYRFHARWGGADFYSSPTQDCSIISCPNRAITVTGVDVIVVSSSSLPAGLVVNGYSGSSWTTLAGTATIADSGVARIGLPMGIPHRFRTTIEGQDYWSVEDCILALCTLATIPVPAAQPCEGAIACENRKAPIVPRNEWDISPPPGSPSTPKNGDPTIQGFATAMSVNVGETVHFKVKSTDPYRIDIYRLGYYGGLGARLVGSVPPVTNPIQQEPCQSRANGLVDCGNWIEQAWWTVGSNLISGVYLAKLIKTTDGGNSHIVFVVRQDDVESDITFQTSDTTWQAYNPYTDFEAAPGVPARLDLYSEGHPKVSYNRPLQTRDLQVGGANSVFGAEYAMIRWLEANGYDVKYVSGVDVARRGAAFLGRRGVFLSVGHDEYWSGQQRDNVEAARDAGKNLAFFSGNEVYWKTRWEDDYRTLVCYRESWEKHPPDPSDEWTGVWRDDRGAGPGGGGRPENSLTGTLYSVDAIRNDAISVPAEYHAMRLWRSTGIASVPMFKLPEGTLGYEWDEDMDNGFRPPGLGQFSSTTVSVPQRLGDYERGNYYSPGPATHRITMYRSKSGSLVFGAGTVQWSWGLDDARADQNAPATTSKAMQQATVNLLADMGVQPAQLDPLLVRATASNDTTAPSSTITEPAEGAVVIAGTPIEIRGTASDGGGGVVNAVEISVDGGTRWHRADGRESWSYTWTPSLEGPTAILSRAVDDSLNLRTSAATHVLVGRSMWALSTPAVTATTDASGTELGLRFRSTVAGTVEGVRFYKGAGNTGQHVGHLWSESGDALGAVVFASETGSGWQQAMFPSPIEIQANTTYVVSYFASNGHYAEDPAFFQNERMVEPLCALSAPNGVRSAGGFPSTSSGPSNFWVDVVFVPSRGLWSRTTVPAVPATSDWRSVEVGMAFKSDLPGVVHGVRFYKSDGNYGFHWGTLWDEHGNRLAETLFSTETAVGWQTATFNKPVSVNPNTTYVVSYYAPLGHYAMSQDYFNADRFNYPLRAPADAPISTRNGILHVGRGLDGPLDLSHPAANYWVDVVFTPIRGFWDDFTIPFMAGYDHEQIPDMTLGMRFKSTVAGKLYGIRFYKGMGNGGTHVGRLWNSDGTPVAGAIAEFLAETPNGWQQAMFPGPVTIAPNTTYVVSYHTNQGYYAVDRAFFLSDLARGVLLAPQTAMKPEVNGLFKNRPGGGIPGELLFPDQGSDAVGDWDRGANYWVDVVFYPN